MSCAHQRRTGAFPLWAAAQSSPPVTLRFICTFGASNLYQVVFNEEDGEYIEYEIEADSHSEASAKAEVLAADSFVDISYIEVYLIH